MPEKLNRKAKNESNHLILWPMPNQHKTLTSHRGPLICTVTFVGRRSHHKFVKRPESKEILKEKCAQRWRVTHIWHTGAAFFLFSFFLQVRRLTNKLKTGAECRLDRTSFNSTPTRAFSQLSYFCVRFLSAVQKRKDLSLNRLGTKKKSAQRESVISCATVKNSLQMRILSASLHSSETRGEKRKGGWLCYRWLGLISEEHNYQQIEASRCRSLYHLRAQPKWWLHT